MTYTYGLFRIKPPRVELRPIAGISRDLRDHHLVAKWHRLCLRWRKS